MQVMRAPADPTRSPDDTSPPTHLNTNSHWWDGSQIYGSDRVTQQKVRTGEDGKLVVGPDGLPPKELISQASREPGFWIGLALLQSLFMLEHNAICDRLRAEYPSWSDDDLFDHARLVNAALLAKIHTVEWTTAILDHPTMQIGMRANWWGIAGEKIYKLLGRISASEVLSGIPGSPKDHFGVPYSITEEFVAVYRMHPLIPDDFDFRSATDGSRIQERTFREVAGRHVPTLLTEIQLADLFYSFGITYPGAISLHNYPRLLQEYERPDGVLMDLAATDILRSRELGVPRYNAFRKLLHIPPVESFEELTDDPARARRPAHLAGPDAPLAHILARLLPPVRGRAGTRQTPAVPRGRHARKREYGRTRQGAPYSGLHSGPPRLLVARAKSPYSRRRHSHLPNLRAGMACIHHQPDAASGLPETHGRGFVVS
jgi:hypothetical protein